jgi:hypothetical protein
MIKNITRTIFYGALGAFGYSLGIKAFNDVMDPYKRAKVKKKFRKIKDIILNKEEA